MTLPAYTCASPSSMVAFDMSWALHPWVLATATLGRWLAPSTGRLLLCGPWPCCLHDCWRSPAADEIKLWDSAEACSPRRDLPFSMTLANGCSSRPAGPQAAPPPFASPPPYCVRPPALHQALWPQHDKKLSLPSWHPVWHRRVRGIFHLARESRRLCSPRPACTKFP
jgi:hypothetical protein